MRELLVVTDLDGSLLDEHTYEVGPAAEALLRLASAGVPLVLASSKTQAEMEDLAASLPGMPPVALIVENGGAIIRRTAAGRREITVLGTPHKALVEALDAIARDAGARLTGFSALPQAELARLTGLSPEEVRRGLNRDYDEPFLVDEGDLGRVAAAVSRRGLRLHKGGRFYHLTGATDKGKALRVLLGLLAVQGRRFHVVGLGDAPNDLSLLEAADEPILVPRDDGRVHEGLRQALPDAAEAPEPGPLGWNAAVSAVLDRRERGEEMGASRDEPKHA